MVNMSSYLISIVMCQSPFMRYSQIKSNVKKFETENEGHDQEGENGPCALRLAIFDAIWVIIFRILAV